MELDYSLIETDIYRLNKSQLAKVLKSFKIACNESETIEYLRKVAVQLKFALRRCKCDPHLETFLIQAIENPNKIETDEFGAVGAHPFQPLINILIKGEHFYDHTATESSDPDYEQIHFERRNSKSFQSAKRLKSFKSSKTGATFRTTFKRFSAQNSSIRPLRINQIPHQNLTMAAEHVPLIQAGSFSGLQSENPQDFLDKYSLASNSNNWSQQTKLRLFPAHLSGTALAWFNLYKVKVGGNIQNWDELTQELIRAFTPIAQAQNLQSIMEHKVQGLCEPTLTYYIDVVTTCRRYEPNISDARIINYVIQGLRPEICERILTMTNDTLPNLESNLVKAEQFIIAKQQNLLKYDRQKGQVTYNLNSENTAIQTLTQQVQSLTNLVANLQVSQNQNSYRDKSPSVKSKTNPEYRDRARSPYRSVRFGSQEKMFPPRSPSPNPFRRNSSNSRETKYFCDVCHKQNHKTQDCWFKTPKTNPQNYRPPRDFPNTNFNQMLFCKYCKKTNHTIDNCFRLKYNREKNQPKNGGMGGAR